MKRPLTLETRPLKDVILGSYEIIHKKDPEAVQRTKQKPHHIAAGAIFLATKFLKVNLPSDEVSNQMLELYEQNQVLPSANSEAEGSIVGGASHRATSKALSNNEEHVAPNNHSQIGGISTRFGNSNPMFRPVHEQPLADNHVGPPRTSQNHGSYHGSAEMRTASDHNIDGEPKDDLPYEIETLLQTSRRALDGLGNEDLERNVARSEIKDSGESKDKYFGRILLLLLLYSSLVLFLPVEHFSYPPNIHYDCGA
ncbi:hypothetical protein NC651_018312 [Populus alba x Populus x berolinensis]|nr:hypothetical protein NC651_018312 [Populus alba x Populus x berolinensis]